MNNPTQSPSQQAKVSPSPSVSKSQPSLAAIFRPFRTLRLVLSILWDQVKYSISQRMARRQTCLFMRVKGSSAFPSKSLYEMIRRDHPDDTEFFILFSKVVLCRNTNRQYSHHYVFFVNPDWDKHGVENPRRIMTQQMVKQDGRIGFHTYQPTVQEIFTTYGINANEAPVKVTRAVLNNEPYYILERP